MRWFRMYADILDDPKVAILTDRQFRCFAYILAAAAEAEADGQIPMSPERLSWRLRIPIKGLLDSLQVLKSLSILDFNDHQVTVTNWRKRQFVSDNVTARTRRHKANRTHGRNVPGNGQDLFPGTAPEQNRTDTDNTLSEPDISFEHFYVAYPRHEGKKRAEMAWKKVLKKGNGTVQAIMDALERQRVHKEHLRTSGQFCPEWPHPASWLSGERWNDEVPSFRADREVWPMVCPGCGQTVLSTDMVEGICVRCAEAANA